MVAGGHPRLRVVHVLLQQGEGGEGETGYIARDLIARHADADLSGWTIFLCGPGPMMNKLRPAVREMGVHRANLYSERFWL